MMSILLTLMLVEADSVQVKETIIPTYNVMAYNLEDIKKKGFFSKAFGSK